MYNVNFFIAFLLGIVLIGCDSKTQDPNSLFSLEFTGNIKSISTLDTLEVSVKSKKGDAIESVIYTTGETTVNKKGAQKASFTFVNQKLGSKQVTATIKSDGKDYKISENITLLSTIKPKLYGYKILEVYPHDINAYTQGLEFVGEDLYESTGQYGKSSLRKVNYKTGVPTINIPLENQYFGEGLTIVNNKIYQLTWREKTGFIYDLETLKKTGTFAYNKSKEGWGLCNDGTTLYKSDGTSKIWKLNSQTLAEEDYIEMYTNTSKIDSVNELEWVDGFMYANIYKKDAIAIIDPANGAVHGVINLKSLKKKVTQHNKLDVLNGIAYKGEKNILYITGKNWDKLFKIEIFEKK